MTLPRPGPPASVPAALAAFCRAVRSEAWRWGWCFLPDGKGLLGSGYSLSATTACVSQTSSIQDEHQKPCASRCQERRNKLGTSCMEQILIKIALALCVGSATLPIVILAVMRSKTERLSLRPFLVGMGWPQPARRLLTEVPLRQGHLRPSSGSPTSALGP